MSLYKNEHVSCARVTNARRALTACNTQDLTKPVDIVTLANTVRGLTEHPEEAAMPNSLKLSLRDDDSWLFYTDSAVSCPRSTAGGAALIIAADVQEAQELLVAALSMAAAL